MALFSFWGFGKALIAILEAQYELSTLVYFGEILFCNLLNYSIIIMYMHKSVERLTRSEKNFRIIAENAADIIFFYSLEPSPSFSYVTPSVESITGYTARDFYADPKFYLKLVPSEDFERIRNVFEPHAGDPPERADSGLIFRMIHNNGSHFWTEMNHSVIYEGGRPVAVEGIIRDISLMKSAEETLITAKQSRDRLFSYVSHELRLPLSSIMGYIDAINDRTIGAEERDAVLSIIHDKAQVLNRLVDDLFRLSRMESGQFAFNFMLCDLRELSAWMTIAHTNEVAGKTLRFINRLNSPKYDGLTIIADRERIGQVLSNLIMNAVKFSESDGIVTVVFDTDPRKKRFVISVSDQGKGISEHDLPRIFDRFFTKRDEGGGYTGTGLGLTLCKEIIEAHKGTLTVSSQIGRGSTFVCRVPLYSDNYEELQII
ncbi:MAG: PAS domain-containing sensor histidine kinase [Clostridiales Family XIII bacterium]|nr:PAS domain-containing sensor histidine kinase [Clostridiales Family XIII bacterium]